MHVYSSLRNYSYAAYRRFSLLALVGHTLQFNETFFLVYSVEM